MGFLCDLPQHKTRAKKKHLNILTIVNNFTSDTSNNENICKTLTAANSNANNSNNQINNLYNNILAKNRLSDINLSNINNCSSNLINNNNNYNNNNSNNHFSKFFTNNYEHDLATASTTTTKAATQNDKYTAASTAATSTVVQLKRQHTNTTSPTTSINNSSSFIIIRHTLCFYAISSIILALCYFPTQIEASSVAASSSEVETHEIFAEGKSDKEILDILLKNSRYDKRLLPPVHDVNFCCDMDSPDASSKNQNRVGRPRNRGTLTVNVSVLLLSLASPDESSLKYEVEFLLQQQWFDPRLKYKNETNFDFLNAIHHHEDIWLPDTYFIMHGDFKDPLIPMHFALRIYRNGTINYLMRRHLILSCQGRLNIFPFDDPLCSFALESISYEQSAITYVWKNDEDTLRKSPSLTTLNAYLIQNQTITCPIKASWRADGLTRDDEDFLCSLCQKRFETQGNYSCLKVDLIFTRDRAFYFTTVFIPGIILVTSSFITFWLEWNAVPARSMIGNYSCLKVDLMFTRDRAFYFTTVFIPGIILVTSSFITFWLEWNAVPARVMIGVTTMLNFFTTSNGFRSTLPVVSNLTAMNVWDGVCMCFIYASLLEFVCVNYVGRKRPLHNVVYRPGENPVTQRLPAVLSRIGVILASPLEVIESEFLTAISSEKSAMPHTTTIPPPPPPPISPASMTEHSSTYTHAEPSYYMSPERFAPPSTERSIKYLPTEEHRRSTVATSSSAVSSQMTTPSDTISSKDTIKIQINDTTADDDTDHDDNNDGDPILRESNAAVQNQPVKPPRRRASRDPSHERTPNAHLLSEKEKQRIELDKLLSEVQTEIFKLGEKKRDTGGPNEIVACTSCGGGTSPCTHSANNGCATETCFVQVRKKEPPHPIRVAKTIDVIARITFPTAYSIFLIFFFIHYKGFS